jgi:hypothetical protein
MKGLKWAAVTVTVGLAISLTPIRLRGLPPLARDAKTNERDPDYAVTLVGLVGSPSAAWRGRSACWSRPA